MVHPERGEAGRQAPVAPIYRPHGAATGDPVPINALTRRVENWGVGGLPVAEYPRQRSSQTERS